MTRPVRRRPAPLRAEVARTEKVNDHMVRVHLGGPALEAFAWVGPAAHVKLILPEAGATDVVLPEPDADGTVAFGGSPLTMRTYTARSFTDGQLAIDLVLHGHGPAATWAAAAKPGDRVAVSRPRSAGFTDSGAATLLIAGDDSALPAIATILEVLERPAAVLVESADRLDLDVTWVSPAGRPGEALRTAIAGHDLTPGSAQVWVATEAATVRDIRADLLGRGLSREEITTRGYWRAGEMNHPDHDYGED
jgi:NADPH-dependent ferric siderophore reductase